MRTALRKRCLAGLARSAEAASAGKATDLQGYFAAPEDNLLPSVSLDTIRAELEAGAGGELGGKFRAAHSSSALAVNSFEPLRRWGLPIRLAGELVHVQAFEARMPTGLARAQPPHLDVVASGAEAVVAIESKCLEYLTPKSAAFSDRYETEITDERRDGPYFREMLRLKQNPFAYSVLDAAQLIKHTFGIARQTAGRRATLLYLYWQPSNARELPLFPAHWAEIARFADRVAGGEPAFRFFTYAQLWRDWASDPDERLCAHAETLLRRYHIVV